MKNIKHFLLLSEKTNYIIIIVFIGTSLSLLLNHELYRDEATRWLVARDTPDIGSLINLMGYGGHLALWPLILFLLSKSGLPYFSMAVVHSLLILTAITIFIRYAPFSRTQKMLFAFGYYPLYEYNIIARCYVLSVLFLFLIASLYKNRFRRPVLYSLLILLLANTSVHSLVIAIVLSGVYIFELKSQKISITKRNLASFLIIILGISISIYQLWPHPDMNPIAAQWNLDLTVDHVAAIPRSVIGAFLPIPVPKITFWNTLFVTQVTHNARYLVILGLPIFLLSLGFFIKKPKPMLIYLLSSMGLFSIFFLKYSYSYSVRYHGLIFMVFIFSLWIANEYKEKPLLKSRLINRLFSQNRLTYLFTILLLFQTIASPIAIYYELNYDFSASKKTADFLKKNGFINDDTFIATYWSPLKTSILPYIPKPYSKFYFVGYSDYRSFIIGNMEHYLSKNLSIGEVINRIDNAILNKNYTKVLLILGRRMMDKGVETDEEFSERYSLIAHFDKTIVPAESLYIYQLKEPDQQLKRRQDIP